MRVTRQLEKEAWEAFVEVHPGGNVFHTPEMFRVFDLAKGHHPEVWTVTLERSRILAMMMPIRVALRGGALSRFTTRSIAYGGLLHENSQEGVEALQWLLHVYIGEADGRSLFTEVRNMTVVPDLLTPLEACGFAYEPHLNYLVNLDRPADEVFARISRRARQLIRAGLREGPVSVRELTNRTELASWYELLRLTYAKARVPLADRSLFEAAFDVLVPAGMAKFLIAEMGAVPIGCSAELLHKTTIYGWYGGFDRRFGKYRPNELLTWHILDWGARNGYRTYDFGGAGRPDQPYGVRDFKAKFGGELIEPGRFSFVHAPNRLKMSTLGYRMSRHFFRSS